MDKKQLAAQLYTIRDFMKTPEDVKASLKKIRDIGYEAIQISGYQSVSAQEMKSLTDEFDLTICVTHIPLERLTDELDKVIEEHKLWGCKYIGLGAMPAEYRTGKEGIKAFAAKMKPVAEKIYEEGLQFIYHNHKFEFEKYDGIPGLEILLNATDQKAFGFELDTYWVQAGGANPVDWIKKVKGRMKVVHLKDMAIINDTQVFAEIGNGNLNWTEILDTCKKTGVEWYAIEQDKCPGDPFDSLKMSFDYLTNL